MQYAKMVSCSVCIIACIYFIACGRKAAGIDKQTVEINSIPCGYSGSKPAGDSILSDDRVKASNKKQVSEKKKNKIQ